MKTGTNLSWTTLKEELTRILRIVCDVLYRQGKQGSDRDFIWEAFCESIRLLPPFGMESSQEQWEARLENYRLEVNVDAIIVGGIPTLERGGRAWKLKRSKP